MALLEETTPNIGNEALRWLLLMQQYANDNNWQVTISHSAKLGMSISVAHDAPIAIKDRGDRIVAGERKTVARAANNGSDFFRLNRNLSRKLV